MKVLSILVSVCMLVSCRWSEVPAQECYPPDTTGVEDTVIWDEWDISAGEWVLFDGVTDYVLEDGGEWQDDCATDGEGAWVSTEEGGWWTGDSELEYSDSIWASGQIDGLDMGQAIRGFLELYKEYETECWNDSTLGYHREVAGLKGFVKYLRKIAPL